MNDETEREWNISEAAASPHVYDKSNIYTGQWMTPRQVIKLHSEGNKMIMKSEDRIGKQGGNITIG